MAGFWIDLSLLTTQGINHIDAVFAVPGKARPGTSEGQVAWWSVLRVTPGSTVLRSLRLGSVGTSGYMVPPVWRRKRQKSPWHKGPECC